MKNYKSAYSEQLKDPRWQKKRLEVMQSSDFCCEICGDSEKTLHVHHKEYFKGREVWEYENSQLAVICKDCHDNIHSETDLLKLVCSYAPLDGPSNRDELAFLVASYIGIPVEKILAWSGRDKSHWIDAMYETGESVCCIQNELVNKHYQKSLKKTFS